MKIVTTVHDCGCKVDQLFDRETGDLVDVEIIPCDAHEEFN